MMLLTTHRKYAYNRPKLKADTTKIPHIFLRTPQIIFIFSITLLLFSVPTLAKTQKNGFLPLRNIYPPGGENFFVFDRKIRARREKSSEHCKPDQVPYASSDLRSFEAASEEVRMKSKDATYFFAITSDCQMLFARHDQIQQLARTIEVDNRITYCLPGLVQFHWRETDSGSIGLQLLLKRGNRQICTLSVELPPLEILSGHTVFSYSIRSSLNYAVGKNEKLVRQNFSLEKMGYFLELALTASSSAHPELSFMDTTYSDIIYFVDPKSSGAYWTIRQFKFDHKGYFKALDTFIVKNIAEEEAKITGKFEKADSFHVTLDAQRRKVFLTNKQTRKMHGTCAYDWLFRPHRVQIEYSSLSTRTIPNRPGQTNPVPLNEINSVSVDHSKIVFSEVIRKADEKYATKMYIHDRTNNSIQPKCILEVPYRAKFGFIQASSLEQLNVIKLPKFSYCDQNPNFESAPDTFNHSKTTKHTADSNAIFDGKGLWQR
ncbi:hypothetical protein Ddc_11202 [Ditylenchus destructor]|nr:hypothetical protein Ddc_11202 [Ditylenchus destructor]